jgi:hypothetical protein
MRRFEDSIQVRAMHAPISNPMEAPGHLLRPAGIHTPFNSACQIGVALDSGGLTLASLCALQDCKMVLKMQPWHFGAASGMGLC